MSLRKLPEIKAYQAPEGLHFEPDETAVARWQPGVQSAVEGEEGVISIYDVIGEDPFTGGGVTSKRVAGALRNIGARDVTVNINSPGGDFFEGVGIYSLLREHKAKVTVRVMGLAASAASVIAMAGDDIEISPMGFVMVHNAWAVAVGNRHDFREAAGTLEPFDGAMATLYAARSGAEESVAAEWMDKETWFNAKEAVEAGMADEVMDAALVKDEEGGTSASIAIRKVDTALAKQNFSRAERRKLLAEIKGTHDAAIPSVTHDADFHAAFERFMQHRNQ